MDPLIALHNKRIPHWFCCLNYTLKIFFSRFIIHLLFVKSTDFKIGEFEKPGCWSNSFDPRPAENLTFRNSRCLSRNQNGKPTWPPNFDYHQWCTSMCHSWWYLPRRWSRALAFSSWSDDHSRNETKTSLLHLTSCCVGRIWSQMNQHVDKCLPCNAPNQPQQLFTPGFKHLIYGNQSINHHGPTLHPTRPIVRHVAPMMA